MTEEYYLLDAVVRACRLTTETQDEFKLFVASPKFAFSCDERGTIVGAFLQIPDTDCYSSIFVQVGHWAVRDESGALVFFSDEDFRSLYRCADLSAEVSTPSLFLGDSADKTNAICECIKMLAERLADYGAVNEITSAIKSINQAQEHIQKICKILKVNGDRNKNSTD